MKTSKINIIQLIPLGFRFTKRESFRASKFGNISKITACLSNSIKTKSDWKLLCLSRTTEKIKSPHYSFVELNYERERKFKQNTRYSLRYETNTNSKLRDLSDTRESIIKPIHTMELKPLLATLRFITQWCMYGDGMDGLIIRTKMGWKLTSRFR